MTANKPSASADWAAERIVALTRLQQARDALARATPHDQPAAQLTVSQAVHFALDHHCSWGDIGEVLHIARGNAYQRYRTKPPALRRPDAPPL